METRRGGAVLVRGELSENQCGMETVRLWNVFVGVKRVEREPMWDGNGVKADLYAALHSVEREPMWDGNGHAVITYGYGASC